MGEYLNSAKIPLNFKGLVITSVCNECDGESSNVKYHCQKEH